MKWNVSEQHQHLLLYHKSIPYTHPVLQAEMPTWPLSFRGTSPASPMASHPVGTLCWSDAPWAHQKDWKPHLLGSLHTPGMNPERKTDVSLAETYLSQGSYWPACLQTHPEDLTMTPTATSCAAVPQGGWLWATEPLPSGGPCRTASTPMLCLHHSGSRAPSWGAAVPGGAHSPFHLPCITVMGQKEFSQLVARQRAHRCPLVPVTDCTKPKAHRLPVPHWSESTCTAIGIIRTALS